MQARSAWGFWDDVDALEEVVEGPLLDSDRGSTVRRWVGKPKRTLVETLVDDAQAGAVEEEDLDRFASFSEEDEESTAAGLAGDALGRDAGQTVEAPAEVNGLEADEDVNAAGNHEAAVRESRTSRTAARVTRSNPGDTKIRAPRLSMRMGGGNECQENLATQQRVESHGE
jgi:hypothetical protein